MNAINTTVQGLRTLSATDLSTDTIYQTTDFDGGQWYYHSNDSSIDNTGTILRNGTGCFKRIYNYSINVKWFGAVGDGSNDDTQAFVNAINLAHNAGYEEGGIKIFIPAGTYKLTSTLTISKSQVKLEGEGVDLSILSPIGDYSPAVEYIGQSYQNWLNAVEFQGISIIGNQGENPFTGIGLSIINVGLRSLFENINIGFCGSIGLYIHSSFDHVYRNVEIRGCLDKGIHIFEQNAQTAPTLPFEEISFLTFENVRPIANNNNGLQWHIQGGDSFRINNCKPSEGQVGIRLDSLSNRHQLVGLYIDGLGIYGEESTDDSVGVQIDNDYCRGISIDTVSAYRVTHAVEVIRGQGINISDIQVEYTGYPNVGNAVTVRSTCQGVVKYKPYNDAYSTKFIDETGNKLMVDTSFSANKIITSSGLTETKPLNPNIQTISIDMTIPQYSNRSAVVNIPLSLIATSIGKVYFLSASIDNIDVFENSYDSNYNIINAQARMHDTTSIDVVMQCNILNSALAESVTRTVKILIVSE